MYKAQSSALRGAALAYPCARGTGTSMCGAAKQSSALIHMKSLDCRVASLLAMTTASKHPWRSLRRWRPLRTAAIASELLFACLRVSVLSRRQRTLCRGHDFLDARQELHQIGRASGRERVCQYL